MSRDARPAFCGPRATEAQRERWQRIGERDRRRHAPPCRRCCLPMEFDMRRDWWRCSCGHTVTGSAVFHAVARGRLRAWLWRWCGVA